MKHSKHCGKSDFKTTPLKKKIPCIRPFFMSYVWNFLPTGKIESIKGALATRCMKNL